MTRMKSISQAQNRVLHLPRYRVFSGTARGIGRARFRSRCFFRHYQQICICSMNESMLSFDSRTTRKFSLPLMTKKLFLDRQKMLKND